MSNEPADLAAELGVSAKTLRAWLRRTYPRSPVDHQVRWKLTAEQVEAVHRHFGRDRRPATAAAPAGRSRADSDEVYVLDLCDDVLAEAGRRQHRFEWLRGDPSGGGRSVALPVDAYYPFAGIVVEYRERQHDEPVEHFDKPDRLTVSGVHRGEQRRRYDARREELIPARGLRLVVVRPSDLTADRRGRLHRNRDSDLTALRKLLGR